MMCCTRSMCFGETLEKVWTSNDMHYMTLYNNLVSNSITYIILAAFWVELQNVSHVLKN